MEVSIDYRDANCTVHRKTWVSHGGVSNMSNTTALIQSAVLIYGPYVAFSS